MERKTILITMLALFAATPAFCQMAPPPGASQAGARVSILTGFTLRRQAGGSGPHGLADAKPLRHADAGDQEARTAASTARASSSPSAAGP